MKLKWVALVVLAGCARTGMGVHMTQAPEGEVFCAGGPKKVDVPFECAPPSADDSEGKIVPASVVNLCLWHLKSDPEMQSVGSFVGVMDFEIAFDAKGKVSEVCLVGSNYGDQLDYTQCVMNEIRRLVRHEPLARIPYRLTFCLD